MAETKDVKKRIHVSLSGNALKHVIEIRHAKEDELGLIQSATSIVCEAIQEKYVREIQNRDTSKDKTIGSFFG